MIAKRLRQGKDVAGIVHLVKYITNPQGKNHRVGEVFITNCISETPMMAVREMLAKQLLNTRSTADKTYHLLVSFQRGEQPAQLRKIEIALCVRLGYDQHQRVAAVHYDKLIKNLSGPLRAYLPEQWIESAGGMATRVAAFSPSGHGMVHDSAGTLSGSVLSGYSGMVADGKSE